MDPLSVCASIAALIKLSGDTIGYLIDVKDAPKQCEQCFLEVSNVSSLLTVLIQRTRQAEAGEPWFEQLSRLSVKDGAFQQYEQALVQLKSKVDLGHGLRKAKARLLWKFTVKEVEAILSRIERLKSLINVALTMDHFSLCQAIDQKVTALRDALVPIEAGIGTLQLGAQSIRDDTRAIRDATKQQKHRDILHWLSSEDPFAVQHDVIARKQDGTAQWFLDSPEFKKWTDGSEKTLLCPGIPGAGKTMMAAVAIDHLQRRFPSDDIAIVYLFCNYKAKVEQTTSNLYAVLLKQFLTARRDLLDGLEHLYDRCQGAKASAADLYKALRSTCSAFKTVYLTVDALDELSEDNERKANCSLFIDQLQQLQASANVKILFTTRFIPRIIEKFDSTPKLEVRASEEDVRRFVKGQLPQLPKCIRADEGLQNSIINSITDAAEGMFLLAQLHVKSLYDKRNRAKVFATLEKISSCRGDLDVAYSRAYDEAIERIDSQSPEDRSLAKSALCWISYARRQLTPDELICALAVEPNDKKLDLDNIYDIEEIVSVCAGLLSVDEDSGVVRLVHYTTQEYFERVRITWSPEAQSEIARTCLTYLCFETFQSGGCDNDEALERRLADNKFFNYSVRFWSQHVRPVQDETSEQALKLLHNRSLVDSTFQAQVFNITDYMGYSRNFPRGANGFHLVAVKGLEVLCNLLLEDKRLTTELDTRDSHGCTPLSRAAKSGHEIVVEQLLKTGLVDIDSKDNSDRTPLYLAAHRGHESIVERLLTTDKVDVNPRNYSGHTPLFSAAKAGCEIKLGKSRSIGQLDADSKDILDQTPLSAAAGKGYKAVVDQLLATGKVDINSKNYYGRTPLFLAAQRGHHRVVERLLEIDRVDADSKDSSGQTPLSAAAENGYKAALDLLLATGKVDVNSKDEHGKTPLFLAAREGHERVVERLLVIDQVDADSKDISGQTSLSAAAENGHEAVVDLLLATGKVDVNSKDEHGHTPLLLATERGYKRVVEQLLTTDQLTLIRRMDTAERLYEQMLREEMKR